MMHSIRAVRRLTVFLPFYYYYYYFTMQTNWAPLRSPSRRKWVSPSIPEGGCPGIRRLWSCCSLGWKCRRMKSWMLLSLWTASRPVPDLIPEWIQANMPSCSFPRFGYWKWFVLHVFWWCCQWKIDPCLFYRLVCGTGNSLSLHSSAVDRTVLQPDESFNGGGSVQWSRFNYSDCEKKHLSSYLWNLCSYNGCSIGN